MTYLTFFYNEYMLNGLPQSDLFKNSQQQYSGFISRVKTSLQFPHFPRIISAGFFIRPVKYFSAFLLAAIIVLNLLYDLTVFGNQEKQLRQAILHNPFLGSNHERLGEYYLTQNIDEAKKEYYLAQDLFDNTNPTFDKVLGVSVSPWQRWLEIESQKEKARQEIKLWEELKSKHPDYLYANLKLAHLNFQLGDNDLAKNYLLEVLKKSPTDKTALELLSKIP